MVCGDGFVAQPFAQLKRHPLGQTAGVDEDQRGRVLGDEGGDLVEHVCGLGGGGDRFQLGGGKFEGEVQVAAVATVDDGAGRGSPSAW